MRHREMSRCGTNTTWICPPHAQSRGSHARSRNTAVKSPRIARSPLSPRALLAAASAQKTAQVETMTPRARLQSGQKMVSGPVRHVALRWNLASCRIHSCPRQGQRARPTGHVPERAAPRQVWNEALRANLSVSPMASSPTPIGKGRRLRSPPSPRAPHGGKRLSELRQPARSRIEAQVQVRSRSPGAAAPAGPRELLARLTRPARDGRARRRRAHTLRRSRRRRRRRRRRSRPRMQRGSMLRRRCGAARCAPPVARGGPVVPRGARDRGEVHAGVSKL